MAIRYRFAVALVAGALLFVPEAVFANGNHNDHANGGERNQPHGAASHYNSQKGGGQGEPPQENQPGKANPHAENGRNHAQNSHGTAGKSKRRSDEHANRHAKRQASAQSAVHGRDAAKNGGKQANRQKANKEHAAKVGKRKRKFSRKAIHNEKTKHQAREEKGAIESKRTENPSGGDDALGLREKKKPVKRHNIQKEKTGKNPRPRGRPDSRDVPEPAAVISVAPSGGGAGDHRSRKNHDRGLMGSALMLAPDEWYKNTLNVGTFFSYRAGMGNQWIHAPPAPPPKAPSLF